MTKDIENSIKSQKIIKNHIKSQKEIKIGQNKTSVKFNFFNFYEIVNHEQYLIIAKTESNLTVRSIIQNLYDAKKIDECMVFSQTEKETPFYSNFIDNKNIFHELKSENIINILDSQEKKINNGEQSNICLVLDCCSTSDKTIKYLLHLCTFKTPISIYNF
jgi:hypothetical protein